MTNTSRILALWTSLLVVFSGCASGVNSSPTNCVDSPIQEMDQTQKSNHLFPILVKGKWGFIDKTGGIVIQPSYHAIDVFSIDNSFFEDRISVGSENNEWGVIDKTGKVIAKPQFQKVSRFTNRYAAIKLNNKWGFIDWNGKIFVPPQFDDVSPFFEERAFVKIDYLWGIIDLDGNWIAKPQFNSYTFFSEGLAAVAWSKENRHTTGFVDRNGRIIVELQDAQVITESVGFRNGRIPIRVAKFSLLEKLFEPLGGQSREKEFQGFVDRNGKIVIQPKYDSVQPFNNCLAPVSIDNKSGLINTKGETVIKLQFDDLFIGMSGFANGLTPAKIDQKYGYIDLFGRFIIKPQFYDVRPFSEDLAAVQRSKGGKWGFIDRTGKFIIQPQFNEPPSNFISGLSAIRVGSKRGYIDKNGQYVWIPTN